VAVAASGATLEVAPEVGAQEAVEAVVADLAVEAAVESRSPQNGTASQ
jgi:hypothetical protein